MEGIEYYKSQITDEEVIKALTRDGQAREGLLEKPRVRPNLNFLQRTVSNMVSSNNRLTIQKGKMIEEKGERSSYRPRRTPVRKKLHMDIIQDILLKNANFVNSSDQPQGGDKFVLQHHRSLFEPINSESSKRQTSKNKKSIKRHKTQLEVVREILIGRIDSLKACKAACGTSGYEKSNPINRKKYKEVTKMKNSMRKNGTCSFDGEVITLDSDSSSSESDNTDLKSDSKNISEEGKREKYEDLNISYSTDDLSRRKRKKHVDLEDNSKSMKSNNDGHSRRNIKKQMIEVFNISDSDSVDGEAK